MGLVGHALVSVGKSHYLIANGHRYPIPSENLDAALHALNLDADPVVAVDATWINLFPQGSTIKPFSLSDAGTPVTTLSSSIANPTAGSLLVVSEGSGLSATTWCELTVGSLVSTRSSSRCTSSARPTSASSRSTPRT